MKSHRRHLAFAAAISLTLLILMQYQTQVLGEGETETVRLPTAEIASPPMEAPPSPDPVPTLTSRLGEAERLVAEERWIEARDLLSEGLTPADAIDPEIRLRLEAIHGVTFLRRYIPGDPFTSTYVVQPGDSLERIARRLDLSVDWRLLQRVNGLRDAAHIRFGQQLKVVRGPFHVRVDKSDFRTDVFAGPSEEPENWVYVRSFSVGLGADGLTPVGTFVVKNGGKVIDPFWTDPRSGRWYGPGDPENPIGNRWIGLEGVGEYAALSGYGFHGTVEPESIGGEGSLGCVRMLPDDVGLLYELLSEGQSVVEIRP